MKLHLRIHMYTFGINMTISIPITSSDSSIGKKNTKMRIRLHGSNRTCTNAGDDEHCKKVLVEGGFTEEQANVLVYDYGVSCPIDMNAEYFARDSFLCRFELMSNYDCMNSYWFESQTESGEPETEGKYWGDVLKVLEIGTNNPLVDREKLNQDVQNTSSGANLLTIPVRIEFKDLCNTEFTIPKGTEIGMYDSYSGGGGLLNVPLLRDYKIVLNKPLIDQYTYWRMVVDALDGYAITDTYGTYESQYREI